MVAKELTETVKPILDANNVKLVGIGFDSKFVKPFVEGKFFAGDLYLDNDRQCYEALQYQK